MFPLMEEVRELGNYSYEQNSYNDLGFKDLVGRDASVWIRDNDKNAIAIVREYIVMSRITILYPNESLYLHLSKIFGFRVYSPYSWSDLFLWNKKLWDHILFLSF